MLHRSNLLYLIILFFLAGKKHVNGFTSLVSIASRNSAPVNPTVPVKQSFQLNAARRRRTDDTNVETANAKLRGIRHKNFGKKLRTWMESYELLLEYKRLNQHCRVPQRYSPDSALGRWVETQRLNGKESLSLEQLKLLDKAGFDWETQNERYNRLWQESYQKITDYKELYGNCCVPTKYKPDKALGIWVHTQRQQQKQGRLRADRKQQLDAIGFTWSVKDSPSHVNTTRVDRLWNETFDRLLEFREEWGHCLVPKVFDEDPSLGRWVATQRVLFKRGQLLSDRKKRLEEIEFVFEPSNTEGNLVDLYWDVMFQHLVDYKTKHGNTDVKQSHEEYGLGWWVSRQRSNKSGMDEQRKTQLDGIGFNWHAPRYNPTSWQERYEELCEHRKLHGTCRVKKEDNPRLAQWVCNQRSRIKRGDLSEKQIKQLDSIDFT